MSTSLITMILMLSLVVLTGFLGQVSLVNLSLAGTAAYAAARLRLRWDARDSLSQRS